MNHLALYEVADEYQQLFQQLSELENIDEQVVKDSLAHVQDKVEVKAVNVAAYIKNLEAEAQAIKTAQDKLMQRQKRVSAKIKHFKDYLCGNLQRCGINNIHHPLLSIAVVKNPGRLSINNMDLIPAEYTTIQHIIALEEKKIKQALKNGMLIPGCELIQNESLRIR
jgi:hypothetical protein